jgi:hypothetical protein
LKTFETVENSQFFVTKVVSLTQAGLLGFYSVFLNINVVIQKLYEADAWNKKFLGFPIHVLGKFFLSGLFAFVPFYFFFKTFPYTFYYYGQRYLFVQ